ncbi:hypothetical protein GWI72_13595 [Microvirga tunisiensis]|uniref:Uncharacterized protein n=2 Tax=Pannonibacter tanglangensis TaxID=2750084 RepID=A0A7X5JAD6_9HYPH|nr:MULTISPECIES: hypothetical protein [unclassified Pannonibacter]NBN64804.1 hypothetical protein [Pannonibacter sp. XCT-34]NBN79305.1 hypothetical protein [Pannonibacter sp. XCT-53]
MIDLDRRSFLAAGTVAAFVAASTPLRARTDARVRSISAMTLAPDGRLVVADWRAGALHVLDLPDAQPASDMPFNLMALDEALSTLSPGRVRATALVWHPSTQRAVIAAEAGGQPFLALTAADGAVVTIDPDTLLATSISLSDLPGEGMIWNDTPARSLTVTGLSWQGSSLLVAGVANTDFSSTLRRLPYPFAGTATMARIEMYHAVHNQLETRAPIRAMATVSLGGTEHLLAAYTCTPLVIFPVSDLVDGASVRAKTIAELGFGNTPLAIATFSLQDQGQTSEWVLVANAAKSADLIPLPAIAEAAAGPGLSSPVKAPFQQFAGVQSIPVPLGNLVALVDQGPQFLLALRRASETGGLELVSIRKGAFFRLSDFINEYDMPGYAYPADDAFQQGYIRPFHAMMKRDEGYGDLVR